ncbi:Islet cell autoantigen 1 [Echinococcus granulosus]|uniref:Islet cell autoantigen 1 n=1 Tax=Echinococcus granulosus TaxID=6210 RepID=A0A068X2C0_ECHGR|nr:Islet cell autoantigen 1 [Echinococcus granulosus]CDS24133.1 Islet cell autoantigen 1 [Echinococcus granulosus]
MYHTSSGDRYREYIDDSTSHKLKSAYWSTKQAVIRKLGKEEDRHIIASDAELDAKLELFKSVQRTCQDLSNCIEAYLRCIFVLSQVENDTGRFLNARSSEDKTRAGKMLSAVGKALTHSAQQRLILQNPLSRLEQEVQTFRARAIGDTASTIARMESARTDYRGALMWMKNVSEELDPDMYKKLDKFRRVQMQVKKSKAVFDRLKLTCMQKVDLLAASRCNMLSHVLAAYQDTLLQFWERTARTMTTVSNSFKGYQYYEFALLKDLTPESRKLAEQTSQSFDANEDRFDDVANVTEGSLIEAAKEVTESEQGGDEHNDARSSPAGVAAGQPENLLPEEEIDKQLDNLFSTGDAGPVDGGSSDKSLDDLFSASTSEDKEMDVFQPFEKAPNAEASKPSEDADFLKDIFSLGAHTPNFFDEPTSPQRTSAVGSGSGDFLFRVNWDNHLSDVFSSARTEGSSQLQPMEMPHDMGGLQAPSQQKSQPSASAKPTSTPKKPESGDIEAWMKFFADLTPLGNPDQQSTKKGHVLDA